MFSCSAQYNYVSSTLDTVDYLCDDLTIDADAFAPFVLFFGFILFIAGFLIMQNFLRKK